MLALVWKQSTVMACNLSDVDIRVHQEMFTSAMEDGNVQFMYVNISSPSFRNLTMNETEWNPIVEWIWVTEEYKHILSYPIDIDVFTFGLLAQHFKVLKLNVNIENISDCINHTLWKKVQEYLFKVHNDSSGYFCHRYFKNPILKGALFLLSHVTIGYEFHCFQMKDQTSPINVEKSGIIYITIAIVFIIFSFYPMLLSQSTFEKKVDRQLQSFTKADYPYTPR